MAMKLDGITRLVGYRRVSTGEQVSGATRSCWMSCSTQQGCRKNHLCHQVYLRA